MITLFTNVNMMLWSPQPDIPAPEVPQPEKPPIPEPPAPEAIHSFYAF